MTGQFLAAFKFKASENTDPEAVLSFLTGLEDQFKAIQFTEAEWLVIHQQLISDFLPFLVDNAGDKTFAPVLGKAMDLFRLNVINDRLEIGQWLTFYKLAFKMFMTSEANKTRIGGLELIQTLVTTLSDIDFDVEKLVRSLFGILASSSKSSPTFIQAINSTLGKLCEVIPKKVSKYGSDIKRILMGQLNEQISSRAKKLDVSIIEGCFKGLDSCLVSFPFELPMEKGHKSRLYDALINCSNHPEGGRERRLEKRAALSLFAKHCKMWSDQLVQISECKHWFITLKEWAESSNADDHKLGWKCMESFLRNISSMFQEGSSHKQSFQYLLKTFTDAIKTSARRKEIIMAIMGYGFLAPACKVYLGLEPLTKMLTELVAKTHEVFLTDSSRDNDISVYFPSHLKAIANVLAQMGGQVPTDVKMDVEILLVNMVKEYPNLPPQFRGFAHEAFLSISPFVGLNSVVFQAIIHTCSFPLLTSSDVTDIVATRSFMPFWSSVVQNEAVSDAFLQSILEIIDKLNFDTETFEIVLNNEHQVVQETPESTLTQIIKEEVAVQEEPALSGLMTQKIKKPKMVKDHTILANLVVLFQMRLQSGANWTYYCLKSLMIKSTQYPELSGFYSMISVILESASPGYFEDHKDQFQTCSRYLAEVLEKSFQHELLKSVLSLVVKLPLELVKVLVKALPKPMAKVFKQGHLDLVGSALDALERWTLSLGHEVMKPVFIEVVPSMKKFLDEEQSEVLEDANNNRKEKSKTAVTIAEETEHGKIQRKILLFFGQLSSELHGLILSTEEEQSDAATSWDMDRKLAFDVPLAGVTPTIFLEDLLPRVVELSVNAKQRITRVAACEALYAIVIYLIGKEATTPSESVSFTRLFKRLFPVMLRLAGDEDSVIGSGLFDKLMLQAIHWYSRGKKEDLSAVLVDAILDGLSSSEDEILKQTCKRMLFEYLKWSIKQHPIDSKVPNNAVKILITRLYSLWVHPDSNLRQAASIAFGSFYTLFREELDLVEAYTIEIFVHVMHSIGLSHPNVCEESKDCIYHLLRIIKQKRRSLEGTHNSRRRIPKDFPKGSQGTVTDLITWLIPWTMKPEIEARHKAMEVIYLLANAKQAVMESGLLRQLVSFANKPHSTTSKNVGDWMEGILASVEVADWLVGQNIVQVHDIKIEADEFVQSIVSGKIICSTDSTMSPKEAMSMNHLKCSLIVRYLDWLTVKPALTQEDQTLIELCLVNPSHVGFDPRDQHQLRRSMKKLAQGMALERLFQETLKTSMAAFVANKMNTELLEALQCLNFLKMKCAHFDLDVDDGLAATLSQPNVHLIAREICIEMLDLISRQDVVLFLRLVQMPALLELYEDCMFKNILTSKIMEKLTSSLSLPLVLRMSKFVVSMKAEGELKTKFALFVAQSWTSFYDDSQPRLGIYLCKYIAKVTREIQKIPCILHWFTCLLSRRDVSLKVKNTALMLLPIFVSGEDDDDDAMKKAIESFASQHFPLTTEGVLTAGSSELKDYLDTFEKLCLTLEETGSELIFQTLLSTVCREDNHVAQEMVMKSLEQCPKKLSLLKVAFSWIENTEYHPNVKLRVTSVFLVPLLRGSSLQILMEFFPGAMPTIIKMARLPLSGHETEKRTVMCKRIVAYKMIAELYGMCTITDVHTSETPITKAAFACLKGTGPKLEPRELSKFLVKQLKSARTELIDGSPELKELWHKMQCEAYNAMISIMVCIQDKEIHYFSFLFKEDTANGDMIWQRIVSDEAKLKFSLAMEEIPAKRKRAVAVRRANVEGTTTEVSLKPIHFLSDSSLSQDINSYDFHDSLMTQEETGPRKVVNTEAAPEVFLVELEQDHFGQHECMASLIALINYMHDKKIYVSAEQLPPWMDSIKQRMRSDETHPNVRLFLLKLILNCHQVFKDYAKDLTDDILKVILSDHVWQGSPMINYLSLDVIAMLLSWSTSYKPSSKHLASKCLDVLVKAASEVAQREIARYILEIIHLLCESWKLCINVIYSSVHAKFSHKDDLTRNNIGIQLLGILVSTGLPPFEETTIAIETYFQDLSKNLECHKKEVYQAAAEVLGLSLEYFKEKGQNHEETAAMSITYNQLKKLQMIAGQKALEKFLHCLYMCHQHYPDIVVQFANAFVYSLERIPKGEPLRQALTMLGGAVPFFEDNVKQGGKWENEINASKINRFLLGECCNHECQLAALVAMEKASKVFMHSSKVALKDFLSKLNHLAEHPSVKIRAKVYSILTWMAVEGVPKAEDLLLNGLGDINPSIRSSVQVFVQKTYLKGPKSTLEKLSLILQKGLKNSSNEHYFLEIFSDLMLGITEEDHNFTRIIFEGPLGECIFQKADINTSWKSQYDSGVLTPMFAETLASQKSQSQTSGSSMMQLRATQGILEFTPTQQSNYSTSEQTERPHKQFLSSISQESGGGASYYEFGQFQVDHITDGTFGKAVLPASVSDSNEQIMGQVKIGKRFAARSQDGGPKLEWQEQTKARFSKLHQRKMTRRELLEKERRGRRQAQVTLMRSYRTGELPDIQITNADIIKPLRFLCLRDGMFAKKMVAYILSSLLAADDQAGQFSKQLSCSLKNSSHSNKYLTACLLEPFISGPEGLLDLLDPRVVVQAANATDLQVLGILALERKKSSDSKEPQAKRTKLEEKKRNYAEEDTLLMIELYKSIGEQSSARGLYLQEIPEPNDEAIKAMNKEALGNFKRAKDHYLNLLNGTATKDYEKKLWVDCSLSALEKLSAWEDVAELVENQCNGEVVDSIRGDSWKQMCLWPRYISSLHHLQIESTTRDVDLHNLMKTIQGGDDGLLKQFNHEKAYLFVVKGKMAEASFYENVKMGQLLRQWGSRNVLTYGSQKNLLHWFQRLAVFFKRYQIHDICPLMDHDLQAGDHLVADWKKLKKPTSKALLNLCEKSLLQNQYDTAVRMFKLAHKAGCDIQDLCALEVQVTICRCLDTENDFKKRLGAMYRQLMKFDHDEKIKELPSEFQATVKANVLHGLATLLKELTTSENDDDPVSYFKEIIGDKPEKADHFRRLIGEEKIDSHEDLSFFLEEKSINLKLECASNLPVQDLFSIAELMYGLINDYPMKSNETAAVTAIQLHGQCLKSGFPKAIKMFPKLLLLMEDKANVPKVLAAFEESLLEVPSWVFLSWSNQLLSLLHSEVMSPIVKPLVLSLAKTYPQALWFAFNFVLPEIKDKNMDLTKQLELPSLVNRFMNELEQLALPEIITMDFVSTATGAKTQEDLIKLYDAFQKSNYSDQNNAKKVFFNRQMRSHLDRYVNYPKSRTPHSNQRGCECIRCFVKKNARRVTHLSDLSTFLSSYSKTSSFDNVEIPGQYDGCISDPCIGSSTIKIAGFKPAIAAFNSIRKPIKISIIGDDGKTFDFIVKYGEDIRQDQRIQQVFRICSQVFDTPMVTYSVVPISQSLGLLQFVPYTSTLKTLIGYGEKSGLSLIGGSQADYIASLKLNDDAKRKEFETNIKAHYGDGQSLRNAFLRMSCSFEGFFFLRSNFMISHAQACIVGYILSIGDRHADNMLISLQSGKSIAIDFGYAFGSSFRLPFVELTPFRFTPHIQGLMHPFKSEGPFKDSMVKCLHQLRSHEDILMATLSVFIKEPTIDWMKECESVKCDELISTKIETVRSKLYANPAIMINSQIDLYAKSSILKDLLKKLVLSKPSRNTKAGHKLSEEQIVSILIDLATDGAILLRQFAGWSPHL